MTIDEAIKYQRDMAEKYKYQLVLNETGHPMYALGDREIPRIEKYVEEYTQVAEWLEELRKIKEMDLEIPQHFNKEQSEWIKAYCIKKNIEFYNKAIDDLMEELEKIYQHCVEMHDWNGQSAIDEAIETIKQLKVGGENE